MIQYSHNNYTKGANNGDGDASYFLMDCFLKMGNMFVVQKSLSSLSLRKIVDHYVEHEEVLRSGLRGETVCLQGIDTFVNTRDKNNSVPFDKERHNSDKGFGSSLPEVLYGISTKVPEKDRDLLGIFIRMHQVLKKCRNAFNHGLADRPELPKLLILLDLYMDYADHLYDARNARNER